MSALNLSQWRLERLARGNDYVKQAALSQLGPKWESKIDPTAEFRLFLSMNKSGSLLSSATSTLHSASLLEIWDTSENVIRDSLADDYNGVSSMVWRSDDSYYLGSHNSTIRYYREGQRCGE